MEQKQNLIDFLPLGLLIFISAIIISWYAPSNTIETKEYSDKNYITNAEASRFMKEEADVDKRYFYERKRIVEITRTKIPFKYKKVVLSDIVTLNSENLEE